MPYSALEQPGAHERHLLRKRGNPLFGRAVDAETDNAAQARARVADEQERDAFMQRFQALLQQAMGLKPNEESEVLLTLKGALDEAYTRCTSLGGDLGPFRQGLARLTETVMAAVRAAAGTDPQAMMELDQEALARASHYRLLEHALVADLMRPDSVVPADELVPTLLSAQEDALEAALWLFDGEHLRKLGGEGRLLLSRCREQGVELPAAWRNLARLEQAALETPLDAAKN